MLAPLPSPLNEQQRLAVEHGKGPLIIFAGAGSGKTRTIVHRMAALLASVPPYRILAVTFTNKAAGEMKNRLQSLVGPELAADVWIGTFHSVCAKLLRRYGAEVGVGSNFLIYDDADQRALMARIEKQLGIEEKEYPPKLVLSRIAKAKREGRRAEAGMELGADATLARIYTEYEQALKQANAVDFEDLILYTTELCEADTPTGRELRRRFEHVLVDEFQDTNLIQYRLVRALSQSRNICVVGDDDQSIYGWRGADVRIIRGFRKDFPEACVIKLEQNYRSSGNIVKAALAVISRAEVREPKELWTAQGPGAKVVVAQLEDERQEARYVAEAIKQAVRSGTRPTDIAVFYRVHAQSRVLEDLLRSQNIAYQVIGGTKFFERAEVKDLLAYLRLAHNPRSDTDLLRIINVPARGIGDKTIEALSNVAQERALSLYQALTHARDDRELPRPARRKLGELHDLLESFREHSAHLLPHELGNEILERVGYRDHLRAQDTAEADARLGNLEELLGSMHDYEQELLSQGDTPSLAGYLERVSLVTAVDAMGTSSMVSLMTVHSAKGLEFERVFLTGMEEDVFPYRGISGEDSEELDEERRLAYVALTRARTHLTVTCARARMLFGRTRYLPRSRFLSDLPEDAVEWHGMTAPRQALRTNFPTLEDTPEQSVPSTRPGERIVERDMDVSVEAPEGHVQPGDRVFHKHFGHGIVRRVEFSSQPFVVAEFIQHGIKRIAAQFLERA